MLLSINSKLKIVQTYQGTYLFMGSMQQGINQTAEIILRLCDGTRTYDEIIDKLKKRYSINEDDENSIHDFIDKMIITNAIEKKSEFSKRNIEILGGNNLVVPTKFSIEMTTRCQLRCKHCFNNSGTSKRQLNFDDMYNACKQLVSIGVPDYFLTGGEATLFPGVETIIDYLSENARSVILATNGLYIKKKLLSVLEKKRNVAVQISLDGLQNNHDYLRGKGSFDHALKTIQLVTEKKIPVIIAYTLNSNNLLDVEPAILWAKENGCVEFRIGVTLPIGRALGNLDLVPKNYPEVHEKIVNEMYKKYNSDFFKVGLDICEESIDEQEESISHSNKCGAGYMFAHLESSGNVVPCPSLSEYSLGNILERKISEVFQIKNIEKCFGLITPTRLTCKDCESYSKCKHCISSGVRNSKLVEGCVLSEQY